MVLVGRLVTKLFGDKETAVEIRGNSHYRNSRNAYRFVQGKNVFGQKEGLLHVKTKVKAGYLCLRCESLSVERLFCIIILS